MVGFEVLAPVKRLTEAKQRLSGVMAPTARGALMAEMAANVLRALVAARGVARVFVVTPDPAVVALAAQLGAEALPDPGFGLNAAIASAVAWRRTAGASAFAIIQGDLPLLEPAAVDAFLALAPNLGDAALTPDQHGRGTSAIAWRGPPHPTRFAFGEDSFARHTALLRDAGLNLTRASPTEAFHDLDEAADLIELAPFGSAAAF